MHALNVNDEYANTYAHDENNVDSCSSDEFVIDNISAYSNVSEITCSNDQAFSIVKVHTFTKPKSVKFKIDTGSQVNNLPKRVFDALKLKDDHNVQIIPSNANLTAYSEQS